MVAAIHGTVVGRGFATAAEFRGAAPDGQRAAHSAQLDSFASSAIVTVMPAAENAHAEAQPRPDDSGSHRNTFARC